MTAFGGHPVSHANTGKPKMDAIRVGVERYRVESVPNPSVSRVTTTVEKPVMSARAELVERLLAIRRKAIANGMQLQTMDEIRAEIEAARELGA
jgi:hypothetical protein